MPKNSKSVDLIGKENFLLFLLTKKKLTNKFARDVVSRCNRISRELNLDLAEMTKNQEIYQSLTDKIWAYAVKNYTKKEQIYAIGATWRSACKYYCEYKWGKESVNKLVTSRNYLKS
jgi:hypothetical protein